MEYITNSEIETQKIGEKIAKKLKAGCVLALIGDLGSGKTAFTKGVARGLGIKDIITSPTFVLIKEYQTSNFTLVHADCYRIDRKSDAESTGLLEYLNRDDAIVVIEWAERVESILPKNTIKIKFEHLGENKRKIVVK